ncbi:MAG: bifunctional folylpolyglutamate synthase/dihydrofolate synthase [Candidatus Omnitrophica bacterium]|nr:bifunctional folylpolyglutamate synthase/dihydrofolate synthase [Candidatus Omnitrophota bacterium]
MNHSQAIKYLNSFFNYERRLAHNPGYTFNLDRMRQFSKRLGNPERKFRSVLVAGTKGKGSTVAMLDSILRASGYQVGMYTSPHLIDLRERIAVGGESISKNDFAAGLTEIRKKLGRLKPTYFEAMTLLAFWQFARKKVDIAVVEVGLGGRLDATNVLDPLVSVITSISYDHTKELGSTLAKIAREKAGIIHYGSVVVTAPQEKEAREVIFQTAEKRKAILLETVDYRPQTSVSLLGDFQIENASVAVTTAHALLNFGFDKINSRTIRRGLGEVRWPGRFEIVSRKPAVILDGAHNGESIEAIVASVRKKFPRGRIIPVIGISRGKDWERMREAIAKATDILIATESHDLRACPARELNAKWIAAPVSKAIQLAKTMASPEDVILVSGSLFLVGEAKQHVQN